MDWMVVNFSCSFATLVESAELGSQDELSFFWTSPSLPRYEPPESPTRNSTRARPQNTQTIRGRRGFAPVWCGASSIKVIATSCGLPAPYRERATTLDGVSPPFVP